MDVVFKYKNVMVIRQNKNVQIILIILLLIYNIYVFGRITLVDMVNVKILIMTFINVIIQKNVDILVNNVKIRNLSLVKDQKYKIVLD